MTWGVARDYTSIISTVSNTNPNEILGYTKILTPESIILPLLYILIAVILVFFAVKSSCNVKLKKYPRVVVLIFISSCIYFVKDYLISTAPYEIIFDFAKDSDKKLIERNNLIATIKNNKNSDAKHTDFNAKIILVLGESASRKYFQTYGYYKDTTPFLSKEKNLIKINGIAGANVTELSVPMILTKATPSRFNEFYTNESIISYVEKYGFDTFWISNQEYTSPVLSNVGSIASEAKQKKFLTPGLADSDLAILSEFKSVIDRNGKVFAIFHLMGSHAFYKRRIPKDFDVSFETGDSVLYDYEKSIAVTDFLLKEMVKSLGGDDLLIYLSDHGEFISSQRHGHGFSPPYLDEIQVPYLYYSNNRKYFDENFFNFQCLESIFYLPDVISGILTGRKPLNFDCDNNIMTHNGVININEVKD